MKAIYKGLNDVFISNTLENRTTLRNSPMPISGNFCYIWNDCKATLPQLEVGNLFRPGQFSINSYIELSEKAYKEFESRCCIIGPNSKNKNQTVRVMYTHDDNFRVIVNGWGNSYVLLWEGRQLELEEYLLNYQKRSGGDIGGI